MSINLVIRMKNALKLLSKISLLTNKNWKKKSLKMIVLKIVKLMLLQPNKNKKSKITLLTP